MGFHESEDRVNPTTVPPSGILFIGFRTLDFKKQIMPINNKERGKNTYMICITVSHGFVIICRRPYGKGVFGVHQ